MTEGLGKVKENSVIQAVNFLSPNVGGHLNHPKKKVTSRTCLVFLHLLFFIVFLNGIVVSFPTFFLVPFFFPFRAQYVGAIFTAHTFSNHPAVAVGPEPRGNVASSNGF